MGAVSSLSQMPCEVTSNQIDPHDETLQELNCALRNVDYLDHSESHLIGQHARREVDTLANQKFNPVSKSNFTSMFK